MGVKNSFRATGPNARCDNGPDFLFLNDDGLFTVSLCRQLPQPIQIPTDLIQAEQPGKQQDPSNYPVQIIHGQ
jgi:hypothetical protein